MSQMTEFEKEYQQHVLQWAHDRNIIADSDTMRQLLKTCTEAKEMVDAVRDTAHGYNFLYSKVEDSALLNDFRIVRQMVS